MDTSVYLDNSKEATSLYAQLEEAQVEIARLRDALRVGAAYIITLRQRLYAGNSHVRSEAAKRETTEAGRWTGLQALLAESHPVMPTVTNGDSSKQPQCGHPPAAIVSSDEGTTHCAWCEDVAQAYYEGYEECADKWLREDANINEK